MSFPKEDTVLCTSCVLLVVLYICGLFVISIALARQETDETRLKFEEKAERGKYSDPDALSNSVTKVEGGHPNVVPVVKDVVRKGILDPKKDSRAYKIFEFIYTTVVLTVEGDIADRSWSVIQGVLIAIPPVANIIFCLTWFTEYMGFWQYLLLFTTAAVVGVSLLTIGVTFHGKYLLFNKNFYLMVAMTDFRACLTSYNYEHNNQVGALTIDWCNIEHVLAWKRIRDYLLHDNMPVAFDSASWGCTCSTVCAVVTTLVLVGRQFQNGIAVWTYFAQWILLYICVMSYIFSFGMLYKAVAIWNQQLNHIAMLEKKKFIVLYQPDKPEQPFVKTGKEISKFTLVDRNQVTQSVSDEERKTLINLYDALMKSIKENDTAPKVMGLDIKPHALWVLQGYLLTGIGVVFAQSVASMLGNDK